MNGQSTKRNALARAVQFIQMNGLYLFAGQLQRKAGITFRRWILGSKLGCPTITLGPRCYLRGLAHIRIGKNFQADEGLWLEAITTHLNQTFSPAIVIGDDVSISRWSHIAATHRIEIGDGVLIGSKVLITDHNHGQYGKGAWDPGIPPSLRSLDQDRSVTIGNNVWIGDGVIVAPGAMIGEGSVIGANSVVTGSIPPHSIAAGVPARCLPR